MSVKQHKKLDLNHSAGNKVHGSKKRATNSRMLKKVDNQEFERVR
jgi:hypothetical protein